MSESSALEALALELCAIESVTGNEKAIADFCEERLREAGVHGLVRAGDNLAFWPRPASDGQPSLVLLGHLDTVPAAGENPPRAEGDRLFGLGVSDMKGACALLLDLCTRAVRDEPRYALAGVLYAAEEGPYERSGLPELVAAAPQCFAQVEGQTKLVVAMEPTDNRLELGCLGTLHASVRIAGKRAHSARPWQGDNAIHAAAPLLAALAGLAPREVDFDGLRFVEVCSATMVAFDGARNVVPESCTLNLNLRFAPDRSDDEACAFVEALVRESLQDTSHEIEITDLCPAGRVCAQNPLLATLEEAAGGELERTAKQAWTDVGRLSRMGLDAVNFGPGDPAQAHQRGESCSRARLAEARAILDRWLWG